MGEPDEVGKLAATLVDKVGEAQALVLAMRLTLLVGQRLSTDEAMAQAAGEAISALKRMGSLAGFLSQA